LPCGRYYVNQIGGLGGVTLRIQGRTALFVGGDVWATGLFKIELDPGAELDLFIQDDFVLTGAARFGDRTRPAAMRIYVGGTGDVCLRGGHLRRVHSRQRLLRAAGLQQRHLRPDTGPLRAGRAHRRPAGPRHRGSSSRWVPGNPIICLPSYSRSMPQSFASTKTHTPDSSEVATKSSQEVDWFTVPS